MPKLSVIGLDSLDPFYLERWVEKGYLPTFERLIENGVFAKLTSTIPPVTIPAWQTMFTGKNPGKLGVFDFFELQKSEKGYTLKPFSPLRLKGNYVWDILSTFGKKSGVINIPEFFTSYEIEGFMVNTQNELSAYPKHLENDLRKDIQNFELYDGHHFGKIETLERNTLLDWELNKYLRSKFDVDLLIHGFRILDVVAHRSQDEKKLLEHYVKMDEQISKYLSLYSDEDLLIVSDHGARIYTKKVYMNSYLRDQGYLKLKNSNKSLTRSLSYNLIDTFPGLEKVLAAMERLLTLITGENLRPSLMELFSSVDWELSSVFAYALSTSNFIGLWLLKKDVDVMDQLLKMEDPEDRRKIVKNIFRKEKIYNGPELEALPDIVIEFDDKYLARSELGPFPLCRTRTMAHQKFGTLIAYGPSFKDKHLLDNAEIADVAPTILHLMDTAVPEDADGQVLKDLFRNGSDPAKREVKRQKPLHHKKETADLSRESEESFKKRLKALGYLS